MGSDDLDSLLRMPRSSRRTVGLAEEQPVPAAGSETEPITRGLRPSELLDLPPEQRKVINWLSRRCQASPEEIQQELHIESEMMQAILRQLQEAGRVRQVVEGEAVFYSVVFSNASRVGRGLSKDIWNLVSADKPTS